MYYSIYPSQSCQKAIKDLYSKKDMNLGRFNIDYM